MQQISIPGTTAGSGLEVIQTGDYEVRLQEHIMESLAYSIVEREMKEMREMNSEIDFDKLQDMLNTRDREMNELAYTILSKHTLYSSRILRLMHVDGYWTDTFSLSEIIKEYMKNNRRNILGRVK